MMKPLQNLPSPTKKQYLKSLNILFESQPLKNHRMNHKINEYKIRKNKSPDKINCLTERRLVSQKTSSNFRSEYLRSSQPSPTKGDRKEKMKRILSQERLRSSLKYQKPKFQKWTEIYKNNDEDFTKNEDLKAQDNPSMYQSLDLKQVNSETSEYQRKQITKKEYLRKGQALNKKILNNLLKKKFDKIDNLDEEVNDEEIVKMINVFKGTKLALSKKKEPEIRKKIEKKDDIGGWENEKQDFQFLL